MTRTRIRRDFLKRGIAIDPYKPWVMEARGEKWIHVDKRVKNRFNSKRNVPFLYQFGSRVVRIPGFKALSRRAKKCIAYELLDTLENNLGERYSTAGKKLPRGTPFHIAVEPLNISSRRFKMSDVAGSLQVTLGEKWKKRGWRTMIFKGLNLQIPPEIYEKTRRKQRAEDVVRTSNIKSIKELREEMKRSTGNSIVSVSYRTKVIIKDPETGLFRPLTKGEQKKYRLREKKETNQYIMGGKGDLLAWFSESKPKKERPKILTP